MRKIKICAAMLLVLSLSGCKGERLGVIKGPEFDYIILGEDVYERIYDSSITDADQGEYLGYVTDGGQIKFEVYDVLNDEDEYRYCYGVDQSFVYKITEE